MSPKRIRVPQFGQSLISDSAAITSETAFSSSITLYFNLYRQFSGSLMPASAALAQPAGLRAAGTVTDGSARVLEWLRPLVRAMAARALKRR